jgi:hypothetical protein
LEFERGLQARNIRIALVLRTKDVISHSALSDVPVERVLVERIQAFAAEELAKFVREHFPAVPEDPLEPCELCDHRRRSHVTGSCLLCSLDGVKWQNHEFSPKEEPTP